MVRTNSIDHPAAKCVEREGPVVARITREFGVVAEQPEIRDARGWGSNPFDVEAPRTFHDHDATDWWCATEAREATRTRRKNEEPVPRKEGRLH